MTGMGTKGYFRLKGGNIHSIMGLCKYLLNFHSAEDGLVIKQLIS